MVSRGCNPKVLQGCQLWWEGPTWLQDQIHINNNQELELEIPNETNPEEQSKTVMITTADGRKENWINRFSTFTKLIRVTTMCIRFVRFCKRESELKSSQSLTMNAKECLIKMEQRSAFDKEIIALRNGKGIPNNSELSSLNLFVGGNSLLRVGGRLKDAELQYKTKHPLVLPHHSKFTELIIQHEHKRSLHAGADATLGAVRQSYWPLRARGTVRKLIWQCIVCFRSKPRLSEQMMGNLPVERVTPAKLFASIGIDFCGPIFIREGRRRGAKQVKAYVAVFICINT